MSKKDRDRERKQRQRQWRQEKDRIVDLWSKAPQVKAALNAMGCLLPFYEGLDSYETEFKKVIAWAKTTFRSLHEVFEVDDRLVDDDSNWTQFGLPLDWTQVMFDCDDPLAASYTARDHQANMRANAVGFHDASGGFHTIIRILKNPTFEHVEHHEYKYGSQVAISASRARSRQGLRE